MRTIENVTNNKVSIVGKIVTVDFGEGKTGKGAQYARATATIRVENTYEGHTEISEIPVRFFATKFTNAGAPNPGYQTIQSLKEIKTIQGVGEADADIISITRGELQENFYVSKNTQRLVDRFEIRGSFINKRAAQSCASFDVDMIILDMHDETNRDGETTGRLIIRGGLVQYGNRLDVLDFIVEDPDKISYISRAYEVNNTAHFKGRIRCTTKEILNTAPASSWGEELPEEHTSFVNELIITTGDDEPLDEERAYDITSIRKAYNERKARIEQAQLDAKNAPASTAPKAAKTSYEWE